MKKAPRPWKKHARIERVELNDGDVKFETFANTVGGDAKNAMSHGIFESLDAAEADLNTWWDSWWPVQVKSRRPA